MTTFTEQDIARLFDVPVESLAGARRRGLMKRLHYNLWRAFISKQMARAAFKELELTRA